MQGLYPGRNLCFVLQSKGTLGGKKFLKQIRAPVFLKTQFCSTVFGKFEDDVTGSHLQGSCCSDLDQKYNLTMALYMILEPRLTLSQVTYTFCIYADALKTQAEFFGR